MSVRGVNADLSANLASMNLQPSQPMPSSATLVSGIVPPDEIVLDSQVEDDLCSTTRGVWRNALVAVKRLRREASRQAIIGYVRRHQALRHPHVQSILGVCHFTSGVTSLVTPFLENGNVMQYLASHAEILPLNIAAEVASGLEYLHSMNVIHGRLRPENILISPDGQACIGDCGLYNFSATPASPSYLSPEAWKGKVSKPSDVFAFAMITYEMYTMGPPWGILSESQIYHLVVREGERPDRPGSDAPYHLTDSEWSIIKASWNADADSRPTSAQIAQWILSTGATPDQATSRHLARGASTSVSDAGSLSRTLSPGISVYAQSVSPAPPAYNSDPAGQEQKAASTKIQRPLPLTMYTAQSSTRSSPRTLPPPGHPTRSFFPDELGTIPSIASRQSSVSLNSSVYPHVRRLPSTPYSTSSSRTDPSNYPSGLGSRISWVTSPGPSEANFPRQPGSPYHAGPRTVGLDSTFSPDWRFTSSGLSYTGSQATSGASTSVTQLNSWREESAPTLYAAPSTSSAGERGLSFSARNEGDGGRQAPASISSTRPSAVIVAGALYAEITEGRKPEVIDQYLDLTQQLVSQSEKEVQKLITAGIIPTLILLVKARAVDGVGIEIVLKTLGMLAHDPLTSNTIFRTNTTSILLEIIDTSSNEDAIALCIWCLSRISRSAEVATGLIRRDVVSLLLKKGLTGSMATAQISSWCLGNLIYTDGLADTLAAQGVVIPMVDHLRKILKSPAAQPDDLCAAIYSIARLARSIKLAKLLHKSGCIEPLVSCFLSSEDPDVLMWNARAVGCLMRPNSADMAKILLDAGAARGLARLPRVIPSEAILPLESFAFAIQRFSCAEWGSSTRKQLVEAGVVDSLLAALRTAANVPFPQVHIELALAVSFLGDVGGGDLRKEIVRAGGIEILKRVGAKGGSKVAKVCSMAVTSITGNIWTRNAGKFNRPA
ncbi:hypothetical protein FRB97_009318 [Tulasnella sp. 331]|nr:hypothetical protein FRB97_009318 [Tulasnella sp. 331]KAG8887706.1 hypothetical protein FRB98_009151 [Tulasnella sp. 332]